MQCPHCAHPDYILFRKNRRAQRYRCQTCRRIFQAIRRGNDPTLQKSGKKKL